MCVTESSVSQPGHPSEAAVRVARPLRCLLDHCFGLPVDWEAEEEAGQQAGISQVGNISTQLAQCFHYMLCQDIEVLYRAVREHHDRQQAGREAGGGPDPQHPPLIPALRPYQAHAVRQEDVHG